MRSVAHDPEIDVDMLARQTTGFTGADIENMINQASIRAASNGFPFITLLQMEEAKDRVVMGKEFFSFKNVIQLCFHNVILFLLNSYVSENVGVFFKTFTNTLIFSVTSIY